MADKAAERIAAVEAAATKQPPTDPSLTQREATVWGTHPYAGRPWIGALWELERLDSAEAVRWMGEHRSEFVSAYRNVHRWVHPDRPESAAAGWAEQRYAQRLAGIARLVGVQPEGGGNE
jgi:hypothetical protein